LEINKERIRRDHKNHGIQSVNSDGKYTVNQQIIADALNKHLQQSPT